ncbi:MAG: efflux RND transporter periplasmic adaptor subunit [Sulfuricurvum sp.]
MSRKYIITAILAFIALVSVVSAVAYFIHKYLFITPPPPSQQTTHLTSASSELSSAILDVKSFTPHDGKVVISSHVTAIIKEEGDVNLTAPLDSKVLSVLTVGTKVKGGDVLVHLDDQALLARKKSLADGIERLLDRKKTKLKLLEEKRKSHAKTLRKKGTEERAKLEEERIELLKTDITAIKTKKEQMESNLTEVTKQLTLTTIRAAKEGIVTGVFTKVGESVKATQSLVSVRANQRNYWSISVKTKALAKALLYDKRQLDLHFLQTVKGMDEYQATLPTNPAPKERTEVKVLAYSGKGIHLPSKAVLFHEGKAYVLVIQGDHIQPQEITIIAQGDEGIAASKAPTSGELAVAKPDVLLKLFKGAPFMVTN